MLAAGFDNFAGEALCNFDGLRCTAPFRHKSWNVRTCAEISPVFERLDPDADGRFFHFCDVLLPLHGRLFWLHRIIKLPRAAFSLLERARR